MKPPRMVSQTNLAAVCGRPSSAAFTPHAMVADEVISTNVIVAM